MYYNDISFSPNEVIEYLRKSRSDDPNMTIDEVLAKHEHMLKEFAKERFGSELPKEHIYREIASSETIAGRPEMLRLLNAIESPNIKAILVVDVQRLSRGDLEDAGRLIKLLRYTNTQIITPMKTYDLQNEWDRDIFERELKRGNEYLEYFKKIQERGRLLSVQEGNFIGSIPPYGYDKTTIRIGKKTCPTLVENKEQADVVRLIFDLYVNKNWGSQRIANYLETLNIYPPHSKHWSPSVIKGILHNYHYIGKVVWNRRKIVNVVDSQVIYKTRPVNTSPLIYDGRHSAIVDTDIFAAAIAKSGKNSRTKTTSKTANAFASILHCSCGYAMILGNDGNGCRRLACGDQRHCRSGSVPYTEFEKYICDILIKYIEDFKIKIDIDNSDDVKLHKDIVHDLELKYATLELKELKQWEKYSMDGMPAAIFDKLNAQVKADKADVEKALKKAKKEAPERTDYKQRIITFTDALSALQNPDASAEVKNQYLKAIIEDIIYTRPAPVRLSRKNCAQYNIDPQQLTATGGWYSEPFSLDIHFKF